MNLSTSSSETASAGAWNKWLLACGGAFAATLVVVWAFLLLVDPYDTGRFSVLKQSGIFNRDPRTANASRGRNPLFNAALIGNSNGQALNPGRLSAATSLRFVQLTVPKTGPLEQLTMLGWFISHHEKIGAIVVVADATWCTSDQTPPLAHPFPFWVYGGNIDYVRHLFSWHALELAFRRIRLALGLHQPTRPSDGFWDYETGKVWSFRPKPRARAKPVPTALADTDVTPQISFPSIDRLDWSSRDCRRCQSLSSWCHRFLLIPCRRGIAPKPYGWHNARRRWPGSWWSDRVAAFLTSISRTR